MSENRRVAPVVIAFATLLAGAGLVAIALWRQSALERESAKQDREALVAQRTENEELRARIAELSERPERRESAEAKTAAIDSAVLETERSAEIALPADPALLRPTEWVTKISAEGPPFTQWDEVPEEIRPSFRHGDERLIVRTPDGRWWGEFELGGHTSAPLLLEADEIPIVSRLALEYMEQYVLSSRLIAEAISTSTRVFESLAAANAEMAKLQASEPPGSPGWFVQPVGSHYVLCSRAGFVNSPALAERKSRIDALVEELGGHSRIGVHGVSWHEE